MTCGPQGLSAGRIHMSHPIHSFLSKEPFSPVYDPENRDPVQDEIDDFFAKLFPSKELRDFMWRLLASHLDGANKEEIFTIWVGTGANGKSTLARLMEYALDTYATTLESSALTRKNTGAGYTTPEIAAITTKLFVCANEPDEHEHLNGSILRRITYLSQNLKSLYIDEEAYKHKIAGKLHILCNTMPQIDRISRGVLRRMYIIPFTSRFVGPHHSDINPENGVFPNDPGLDEKMHRWRDAFFARLVWVYETIYCKSGLGPIPDVVTPTFNNVTESL